MEYKTIDDVVSFVETYYEKNGNKKLAGEVCERVATRNQWNEVLGI